MIMAPTTSIIVLFLFSATPFYSILQGTISSLLIPSFFNKAMSSVGRAVEQGFGKILTEFAFLDFKKKPKNSNHHNHLSDPWILTYSRRNTCFAVLPAAVNLSSSQLAFRWNHSPFTTKVSVQFSIFSYAYQLL